MSVELFRVIALRLAEREVGVKESPSNSNDGPRVRVFQAVTKAFKAPWCASLVMYCLKQAGFDIEKLSHSAYVPFILAKAAQLGWLVHVPAPGDLVCFDWEQNGVADHIGFVRTRVDGHGNFTTVEGNTSFGNQSNGGEVMVRTRNVSEVARQGGQLGFIRVPGGKHITKPKPVDPRTKPKPVDPRPEPKNDTPFKVPPMWAWFAWKDAGSPPAKRPANVPVKIPKRWWLRYKLHVRGRKPS
jgi:hypothetical protein